MKPLLLAVPLLLALGGAALLAACAGSPLPPDWQTDAQRSLRSFVPAYFAGNTRLATQAFARARADIASTGRADLLARAELVRCAARTASLEFDDCPAFEALAADAGKEERAYADFLAGRWQGLDAALLPAQHRALLGGAADASALTGIKDPLSRLIEAGVLFRMNRLAPAGIATAVETASAEGWRRPLLAWLGVEAARADAAGDKDAAARIRRRIELVTSTPAIP